MQRRIRKIHVGVDYKDCFVIVVGQEMGGGVIHFIDKNDDEGKFDVYVKRGNIVEFWKDFYISKIISTEDFKVE